MDDLAKIQELVADSYPNQSTEYVYSGQVYIEEAGDPLKTEATHQRSGFRFTSADERQIFYARLDGFALSIRAPYDRWQPFRDEARRLWELYRSVCQGREHHAGGCSVRQSAEHSRRACGVGRLSEDLARGLSRLHARTAGRFLHAVATVAGGSKLLVGGERGPDPVSRCPDAFYSARSGPFPGAVRRAVGGRRGSGGLGFLRTLRDRKNEVFEASITEKTRRLFG